MRIISGEFRSRRLKSPPGKHVRPTSDRTRESIFNVLSGRTDLDAAVAVDLYAGSGALGLEALSRGAQQVTFVESNHAVMRILKENAYTLGVNRRCDFRNVEVLAFLRSASPASYDIAFADPPYASPEVAALPDASLPVLKRGGFLILEHDSRHEFTGHEAFLMERTYGDTVVSFFQEPSLISDAG